MSPHMDSVLGWMLDLVGGRQSARSLHFIFAMLLLAFIFIHVFMVFVTGPINQIRAMITGRYEIHDDPVQETPVPEKISTAEVPHVQ
jgi:thiosulfate reductase cytochrome b subunit